jgi:hypothetical protein
MGFNVCMTNTTRYYNPLGTRLTVQRKELSNDELVRLAPSVGSQLASSETSDNYSFIPTIEVVDALRDCGYVPVHVNQSNTRSEARQGFQTHEIRLRKGGLDGAGDLCVGDVVPEIVLKNSHDRGSSFSTNLGLFRAVCANGLLISEQSIAGVRCRHVGLEIADVIKAVTSITDSAPQALEEVERFQTINLAPEDVVEINKAAIEARWGGIHELPGELSPVAFLQPKRRDDQKGDLWSVLNVIQENVLRGGQRYVTRNERGYVKRRNSVRKVNSIDTQRKVNQDIWEAAREVAALYS